MALVFFNHYKKYYDRLADFLPTVLTASEKLTGNVEKYSNNHKTIFEYIDRDWQGPTRDAFYKQVEKLKEQTEDCKKYVSSLSNGVNRVNELYAKIVVLKSDNEQYDRLNEQLMAIKQRNANLSDGETPEPTEHLQNQINRLKERLFSKKTEIDQLISFLKNF